MSAFAGEVGRPLGRAVHQLFCLVGCRGPADRGVFRPRSRRLDGGLGARFAPGVCQSTESSPIQIDLPGDWRETLARALSGQFRTNRANKTGGCDRQRRIHCVNESHRGFDRTVAWRAAPRTLHIDSGQECLGGLESRLVLSCRASVPPFRLVHVDKSLPGTRRRNRRR